MNANPPANRMEIDGEFTILTCVEWKTRLLSGLESGEKDLRVDLSRVSDIDTAGLQLLFACRHEATQRGMYFVLTDLSSVVLDAFATLRLGVDLAPVGESGTERG